MKEKIVPSSWLEKEGRRLDCGPYVSGAIEARVLIDGLACPKRPLQVLTQGGRKGVFNGPRFARRYVQSLEHGVPLLSGTEILSADIGNAPLIARKQVNEMRYMLLQEGTTLVTSYGTVGRTAFTRPDMIDSVGSDNVMKIVADPDQVQSGYLYSFLSSRYGIPLVLVGASGSVVNFLDPSRVINIAIPLAPDGLQKVVHDLVLDSAKLRAAASAELRAVVREIEETAGLPVLSSISEDGSPDVSIVKAITLRGRMDGLFHSNYHRSALGPLLGLPPERRDTVSNIATRVFEPNRFRRIPVDDPKYGVPFFGTAAIMRADPEAEQMIARRTSGIEQLMVGPTTILVPRSGQLQGIIGQAVLPHGDVIGGAVSEHGIRVECPDQATAGYLFACLCSEYGRRQLKARAYGSSIPTLDVTMVGETVIPLLSSADRMKLGERAFGVAKARHIAVRKEREARALVEAWIGDN